VPRMKHQPEVFRWRKSGFEILQRYPRQCFAITCRLQQVRRINCAFDVAGATVFLRSRRFAGVVENDDGGTDQTVDTARIEYDDSDGTGYYREFALIRQITGDIFWDPGPVRLRENL